MTHLPLNDSPSAMQQTLGYRMTSWTPDHATFEMPVSPEILNRAGIPHGGALATLLDTTMGNAGCYSAPGEPLHNALTLTLNVSYLAQAQGKLLIAKGRRTGGGRSTFFAEATVEDETGVLIATGSGAFRWR